MAIDQQPTIYLDACCLNRPFDDQTQDRIRLETEAIVLIIKRLQTQEWLWLGSEVLNFEIEQTPAQNEDCGYNYWQNLFIVLSKLDQPKKIEPDNCKRWDLSFGMLYTWLVLNWVRLTFF